MPFATGYLADPNKTGSGEIYGVANLVLSTATFEDDLVVGRFAKLDTGSLDNVDGSASPLIAGVTLRNIANAVEDAATLNSSIWTVANYVRSGYVSVEVVAADTPAQFGQVYVKNAAGADAGKATTVNDSTSVPVDAVFIEEVSTNVWTIAMVASLATPSTVVKTIGALSGAGAISLDYDIVEVTTTAADALTLADGVDGQEITIVMIVDGGDGTLTPANFANGTTATFADATDSLTLQFINSAWYVKSNSGVVVA